MINFDITPSDIQILVNEVRQLENNIDDPGVILNEQ